MRRIVGWWLCLGLVLSTTVAKDLVAHAAEGPVIEIMAINADGTNPRTVAAIPRFPIINSPEVRDLLLKQGAEAYASSPAEFTKVVERDVVKWEKVVKDSGAKAN